MSLISYNLGIPSAPHNPSIDQPDMKDNNDAVPQIIAVDHIGFNVNNSGLHRQVRMPVESIPTVQAGFGGVYVNTAISASPLTESDLFYTPDASALSYQLTRTITGSFTSFAGYGAFGTVTVNYAQNAGWTFLPGGMLFQYAQVLSTLGTPQISPSTIVVTFPVPFTTSNVVVSVSPICKAAGTSETHVPSVKNGTITNTGFICNWDTSTTSYVGFTWTAIGV